jgi:hypothetical protein
MYKKIIFNNYLITIFLVFFINSCGIYKPVDSRKVPVNAKERAAKNVEEGRAVKFNMKRGSGNFSFATSNPLWRASLDILDFTPLSNVDYGGGIIITDWFTEEDNNNNSIKISVRFLSNEIRADGLDVILYKKSCKITTDCKIDKVETSLGNEIKIAILKKAAILQTNDTAKARAEYRKKYGKKKWERDGRDDN